MSAINPLLNSQTPQFSKVAEPSSVTGGMPFKDILSQVVNKSAQNPQFNQSVAQIANQIPLSKLNGLSSQELARLAAQLVIPENETTEKKKKRQQLENLETRTGELRGVSNATQEKQPLSTPLVAQQTSSIDRQFSGVNAFSGQSEMVAQAFPNQAFPDLNTSFDDDVFVTDKILDAPVKTETLSVTPFQFFLDKSMDFLSRVTMMEIKTDTLMELYVRGEASLEELTIEKAKVGVAISFATTVISQVSQIFKEIQNMQI